MYIPADVSSSQKQQISFNGSITTAMGFCSGLRSSQQSSQMLCVHLLMKRQMAKHGVHATNFGAHPRTMAKKLDMTMHQATSFQARWFTLHPAIKEWQRRVEMELMQARTITNAFGYRRIWFDRIETILPKALAWVPQSTTGIVIDKGLNNIDSNLPEAILILQVHDSILGQFKNELYPTIRKQIYDHMLITVPYDDPLVIEVDISCSRKSWGDCTKVPLEDNERICPH